MTMGTEHNNTGDATLVTTNRVTRARSFYEGMWWLYIGGTENAIKVIHDMNYSQKILFLSWIRGQVILGWQVFIEHLQCHRALPFNNAPKKRPYSLIGDASGRALFDFMVTLERQLVQVNVSAAELLEQKYKDRY